jgi:hypothetical protein
MTTATEMSPAEFLESDPHNHPGFWDAFDPRTEERWESDGTIGPLSLPNLMELVGRFGGPDAIPRYEGWTFKDGDRTVLRVWTFSRHYLAAADWQRYAPDLGLVFDIAIDGPDSPWRFYGFMSDDVLPNNRDARRLVARAFGLHVGRLLEGWGGALRVEDEPFVP